MKMVQTIVVDAFNPTQFKIDLLLSEANLLISNLSNLTTEANNTKIVADELKVLLDEYKARDHMKSFFFNFKLFKKTFCHCFSASFFPKIVFYFYVFQKNRLSFSACFFR